MIRKLEAKDVLPNINHTQTAERAKECHFVVHGDFDLDLKIPLSKGPNTSSV